MSIIIKTPEEIEILREAGKRLCAVLDEVEAAVAPGVTLRELDAIAESAIRRRGDTPAFLNYRPSSASIPFPATLCVAPNDVVVHGIPINGNTTLVEGDILGIDTGLVHKGMIVDSGRTVPVGAIDDEARRLLDTTSEALMVGIAAAKPGNTVGDIGYAIQSFVKGSGFSIVEELCGHGVGRQVHEEPQIPNYGRPGKGPVLKAGMVVAIEPMLNEGTKHVIFEDDGYTVRTRDGKRSAHFEHTVAILEDGPEILTRG